MSLKAEVKSYGKHLKIDEEDVKILPEEDVFEDELTILVVPKSSVDKFMNLANSLNLNMNELMNYAFELVNRKIKEDVDG